MAEQDIPIIVSDFQTQLSGAISVGATSFTIQSVLDADGNTVPNGTCCFTIDRDNASAKQYLVGQLNNATKTVSSVYSVSAQGVLTANSQKAHRIGANVIISDHSILSALSNIFRGQGTIDPTAPLAYTSNPTLSSAGQLATKGYVDSVVSGGTVNADRIILASQTAGETVATGDIVYLKASDSRWWKADADDSTTYDKVQLGVALGAGTAGNAISGGVQLSGTCASFTGLTADTLYYLSSTAGGVSTSAGTPKISIGVATSTTSISLEFKAYSIPTGAERDAMAGGGDFGTPSSSNKFLTETNGALKKFGGTGADGALDTSGGTVDIDLGGANIVVKNYTSINIVTNNVTVSNPASTGTLLILRSQGAVTISATLDLRGGGAAANTSGFNFYVDGSLTPNGKNSSGNTGGAGGSTLPVYYTNNTWQLQQGEGARLLVGSGGGNGGTAAGGRGGAGLIIECAGAYNFTGIINTSGTAGASNSGGGGGGGAAGSVIVYYNTLTTDSGTYSMLGGAGAAGGGGTNSAGGGGAASAQGNGGTGGNYSGGNGSAGGVGSGGGGGGATGGGGTGTAGAAGSTMTAVRIANLYLN